VPMLCMVKSYCEVKSYIDVVKYCCEIELSVVIIYLVMSEVVAYESV
jgi:hypothetical protein